MSQSAGATIRPIQTSGRRDAILESLTHFIVQSDLKPGDQLPPERELMAGLKVGRSSIREAIGHMQALGIDVVVSAPQKGCSGSPCCAMVMLSERATQRLSETQSNSFACDLGKWHSIMQAYENGGHAYHATMPTDALRQLRDIMQETRAYGFAKVKEEQQAIGREVRSMLKRHGFVSVAAEGFEAPGVVVCYSDDSGLVGKLAQAGVQVAGGVPLMCDEGDNFQTFRIGLFGLDKLHHTERSVNSLEQAIKAVV